LEDPFGDFHEDYLANARHTSSNTKWKKMPEGTVKGMHACMTNEKYGWNLQIKSKYNSMNSSSAKKLAEQLEKMSEKRPEGIFGCG